MDHCINNLPENVLLCILKLCEAKDLAALSSTCNQFYRLVKDEFLWRHLCFRDFSVSPADCGQRPFKEIYTNLLNKYGHMLGLYQSQTGPYGGLLEIRFQSGVIEGVTWEPPTDVMEPLKESLTFCIRGDEVPAKCVCIPGIYPHESSLHIDKRKGIVTQRCFDPKKHIDVLYRHMGYDDLDHPLETVSMKLVFLNEVIGNGLVHRPLILPQPDDIPSILKRKDGSFPRQIITPGLFKGTYSLHGIEVLLFKYKDEYEIHGYKVTGDPNVYASKISVKILLKYPVNAPEEDQNSITAMHTVEAQSSDTTVDQIKEQPFSIPRECYYDATTPLPRKCIARYHGFGQIAYEGFQKPTFIPVQVVIFDDDLFAVLWIELSSLSLYSRIKRSFTSNIIKARESCL